MSRTVPNPAAKKLGKKPAKKTVAVVPPKPKSLAQAQADFTSEGSPPPGVVGAGLPPAKPND